MALDPIITQYENGESYYTTEQYYRNLASQNMSLVKGFFLKDQIDKLENGYIGYIGTDMKGQYNRSFNPNTKAYYNKKLYEKNREYNIRHELSEKAYSEEKIAEAAKKDINVDMYPEHKLTKEDYDRYYSNR